MRIRPTYDFVIVGAGSAGCAVADRLTALGAGTVLVVEAGRSDRSPIVAMPFGLVWMMGSRARDWRHQSTPQAGLGGRSIAIPRGRMIGGSSAINSMVWFRGRRDDFDAWGPGWGWSDVEPAFQAVEAEMRPAPFATPHPLTRSLAGIYPANDDSAPPPERDSAGVCRFNLHRGRRRSAADAFLRPAIARGAAVLQSTPVRRLIVANDRATGVEFADGSVIGARKGVVLSAGAIGSPELLLQSGVGPADDLRAAGIDVVLDAPGVGANLHDHPMCPIHFAGPNSGYGLTPAQLPAWALAPLRWWLCGTGPFASPTVEGSMFLRSRPDEAAPDIQSHFLPFTPHRRNLGAGYIADATLCRPRSRGRLAITRDGIAIDLGLFNDPADLDRLADGFLRVREILADACMGGRKAPEVFPGPRVATHEQVRDHLRTHAGTAYHPVGTLGIGGPVGPRLALDGIDRLWVADASVMPRITSANTNAPSIMIGYRAGEIIAKDAA